jgi:hypothetical protein
MKKYGLIVADNGSNWYISGAPDTRWSDDELNTLKTIKGGDFEAVQSEAPDGTVIYPSPVTRTTVVKRQMQSLEMPLCYLMLTGNTEKISGSDYEYYSISGVRIPSNGYKSAGVLFMRRHSH